ncbi:hypothetical protein LY76DRAFT_604355 [Colletotrichum caudatum]|nr:hypothetical protein LY76DRAFT_604355 [Colletotrichum caudatum]
MRHSISSEGTNRSSVHTSSLTTQAAPTGGALQKRKRGNSVVDDARDQKKTGVVSKAPSGSSIENSAAATNTMLEIESESSDHMSDDVSRDNDTSPSPQTSTRDSTEGPGSDSDVDSGSEGDNEVVDDGMSPSSLESGQEEYDQKTLLD